MKLTMRLIGICICFALFVGGFYGCDSQNREKTFDPKNDPKQHIDLYEKLTSLYGTERMETLEALGYSIEDTNVVSGFYIGIPEQVVYTGVTFDIYLRFDNDARFCSTEYVKKYAYPAEEEQTIKDVLTIGKQLAQDLGQPDETDGWNNYYEEEYDTEMDPDPPSYQSEAELRKLIENNQGGGLASWDISGFAQPAAKEYHAERYGDAHKCGIYLSFLPSVDSRNEAKEITVTIGF